METPNVRLVPLDTILKEQFVLNVTQHVLTVLVPQQHVRLARMDSITTPMHALPAQRTVGCVQLQQTALNVKVVIPLKTMPA